MKPGGAPSIVAATMTLPPQFPGAPTPSPDSQPEARPAPRYMNARLKLDIGDVAVSSSISVPADPSPAESVLPTLQNLINDVVDAVERREFAAGREISCRQGCGACCRQLVPVSRAEARAMQRVVEGLEADRRQAVTARFAAASAALREAGLAEALLNLRQDRADRDLSLAYFALGLACPFLEDESCSIHPLRPLACREYLVTSPAENCSNKDQAGVVPVAVPKLSVAARGLENDEAGRDTTADWVPLALAFDVPAADAAKRRLLPGPEWVKRFFAAFNNASQGQVR